MTTDPTPLQESIARALRETLTDPYGAGSDLESPGITSEGTVWQRGGEIDVPHMVGDLLPLIAAEVRKAQADALREAADGLMENIDWSDGRSSYGDNEGYEASARELRARAADIEQED